MQYKTSHEKLSHLLRRSSVLLKSAANEIASRDAIIAEYRAREEAQKVAAAMQDKNLSPTWGSTTDEIVQQYMGMPPQRQEAVKEAVAMAAPHDPFAYLEKEGQHEGTGRTPGGSLFEQFVSGQID